MAEKTKKFKVKAMPELCIGAATCEIISPKVFRLDKNGRVIVAKQKKKADKQGFTEVTEDDFDNVLKAAKSCPVRALIVTDEKGQIYPQI